MRRLEGTIAEACWEAISLPSAMQTNEHIPHPTSGVECAVRCNGWVLIPFIDGGDWDYVDRVIAPDGEVFEVLPSPDNRVPDEDGFIGEYVDANVKVFNWRPSIPPAACGGHWMLLPSIYGHCWNRA